MKIVDLENFPGYAVSDTGVVFSWRMPGNARRERDVAKELNPWEKDSGHLCVSLRKDGATYKEAVHVLVLQAFIGPCPDGMEARHKDGNPKNNKLSNLEWNTKRENTIDRCYHKPPKGPRKLTPEIVDEIKGLLAAGEAKSSIAARFGVSRQTIGHIFSGHTWSHGRED